jgi:hypothetical protein
MGIMTEVAIPTEDTHPLVRWAESARAAHGIAQSLAKTSFVSNTLRGKPEEITAAILAGHEMGLQPLASLRSIDVISGTPALRANTMRGLVQSRGHSIRLIESSPTKAIVAGHRRGETDAADQMSIWTIERAKSLGLTGKDNWQKQPQAMLVARATAECCRLVASDVLLGLPYAAEELEDVDAEPPKPRTAKRKALAENAAEPALEDPVLAIEESPTTTGEPVTEWPEPTLDGGEPGEPDAA